jgi:hypothetical protein
MAGMCYGVCQKKIPDNACVASGPRSFCRKCGIRMTPLFHLMPVENGNYFWQLLSLTEPADRFLFCKKYRVWPTG